MNLEHILVDLNKLVRIMRELLHKISILLIVMTFLFCNETNSRVKVHATSLDEYCYDFRPDDFVDEILKSDSHPLDSVILIDSYVKVNDLYDSEVSHLKEMGFTRINCEFLNSTKIKSFSFSEITPLIYDKFLIIELSAPLFNKKSGKMAIIATLHCGNDCGSTDLYLLSKIKNKWSVVESKNLGQM